MPPLSKFLIRTDNSPSKNWAHKVSARSERGQLLVSLYAAMLTRTELTVECNHVAGVDNTLADFISRPPPEFISHPDLPNGAEAQVLQLFPTETRAFILPGVQAVHRTLAGKPPSPKVARTIRNNGGGFFRPGDCGCQLDEHDNKFQ